ncbi:nitroreductase/quinone reductase family protein [Streptacidiphilus sp. PAMC 29251]
MTEQEQAQRLQWNQQIIEEFRANQGVVGGPFAGATLLLLTTRGARSGEQRTMPLAALPAGEGRWAVFAANGGRPARPGWYYNLLADPASVTVEIGTESFAAVAADAAGAEREQLWATQLARLPALADFQATAPGPIPVVVLTRQDRAVSSDA